MESLVLYATNEMILYQQLLQCLEVAIAGQSLEVLNEWISVMLSFPLKAADSCLRTVSSGGWEGAVEGLAAWHSFEGFSIHRLSASGFGQV